MDIVGKLHDPARGTKVRVERCSRSCVHAPTQLPIGAMPLHGGDPSPGLWWVVGQRADNAVSLRPRSHARMVSGMERGYMDRSGIQDGLVGRGSSNELRSPGSLPGPLGRAGRALCIFAFSPWPARELGREHGGSRPAAQHDPSRKRSLEGAGEVAWDGWKDPHSPRETAGEWLISRAMTSTASQPVAGTEIGRKYLRALQARGQHPVRFFALVPTHG